MSVLPAPQDGASRPNPLLTQNREMKAIGAWNWSLPAWAGRLPDGRTYNTCPSAGICAQVCYARNGTYLWPVVRAKHQANLAFVLDDLTGWEAAMTAELNAGKFRNAWIRIHDSGDFFTDNYLLAWLRISRARPGTDFYAYTKEVDRFRRLVEPDPPANFWWVYSYGGVQDHLLDARVDRVADVFPDEDAIADAGWSSQEASDLLAVLGPRLVGIPANRIPGFIRRQRGRRFSHWQAEADAWLRTTTGPPHLLSTAERHNRTPNPAPRHGLNATGRTAVSRHWAEPHHLPGGRAERPRPSPPHPAAESAA